MPKQVPSKVHILQEKLKANCQKIFCQVCIITPPKPLFAINHCDLSIKSKPSHLQAAKWIHDSPGRAKAGFLLVTMWEIVAYQCEIKYDEIIKWCSAHPCFLDSSKCVCIVLLGIQKPKSSRPPRAPRAPSKPKEGRTFCKDKSVMVCWWLVVDGLQLYTCKTQISCWKGLENA